MTAWLGIQYLTDIVVGVPTADVVVTAVCICLNKCHART